MLIRVLLHNIKLRVFGQFHERINSYRIEILLILIASGIALTTLLTSRIQSSTIRSQDIESREKTVTNEPKQIGSQLLPRLAVDISGAVNNPDVYYASPGARIIDMIKMAGGLSYQADASFVGRNFNMSTYVFDQDKIYIPSIWDISQGIFVEEPKLLEYLEPRSVGTSRSNAQLSTVPTSSNSSISILSINSASKEELDMLPGVGPVTAQKIIDNRPYKSTDELLSKKVINASMWDNIREFISP